MGLLDTLLGHAGEKSVEKLAEDFAPLLAPGETLQRAFGLTRDLILFTDRRLILVNKQGATGSKVGYLSLPYRSIVMFSLETAGHFDGEADLRIWALGQASVCATTCSVTKARSMRHCASSCAWCSKACRSIAPALQRLIPPACTWARSHSFTALAPA